MPGWEQRKSEETSKESLRVFFENQSNQIAQIATQIAAVVAGQEAMRKDFNDKWNDLPRIYLPRQEDQARGLEGRVAALETYRLASTKDLSDLRISVQQDLQKSINELQKEAETQRAGIDARAMAAWITGFFLLANIVWSVVAHFILK